MCRLDIDTSCHQILPPMTQQARASVPQRNAVSCGNPHTRSPVRATDGVARGREERLPVLSEQIGLSRRGVFRSLRQCAIPFRYFNSSPAVIRLTVMMYARYPLPLRSAAVGSTIGPKTRIGRSDDESGRRRSSGTRRPFRNSLPSMPRSTTTSIRIATPTAATSTNKTTLRRWPSGWRPVGPGSGHFGD